MISVHLGILVIAVSVNFKEKAIEILSGGNLGIYIVPLIVNFKKEAIRLISDNLGIFIFPVNVFKKEATFFEPLLRQMICNHV